MKNCYLFAASMLLLCACGKDDDTSELNLPGKYRSDNHIMAAAINMYTSSGQLNNTSLIDKFIRRHRMSDSFSRTDVAIPNGNFLTLSISPDNRVTFVSTTPDNSRSPDSLKTEIVSRSQDYLALANLDSVSVVSSESSNRCEQLAKNINQVQPNKRCRTVSVVSGSFSQLCWYRPTSALLIKDGTLRLPLFSWIISSRQNGFFCGSGYGNTRNTLNPAVLNQLQVGDTIVVQVRQVPLIKQ